MKLVAVFGLFLMVLACQTGPSPYFPVVDSDADADSDTDTDSDTDADSDSDTDTDSDADTDTGTDTESESSTEDDTESDSETEFDSESDSDTSCYSVDDCDDGEVCGMDSQDCFDVPEVSENQVMYCWDHEESCVSNSQGPCAYGPPPTWNDMEGTPTCVATPSTCPAIYPTKACCVKNEGEVNCLTQSFFLP